MSPEYRDTETAVEAMLAGFSGDLDAIAPPNAAVVERIKTAVRHELNEQWLASQPGPEARAEVLGRLKWVVRHALAGHAKARRHASLRVQWRAALSAAAVIALCLGLIGHVGRVQTGHPDQTLVLAAAREHVDSFVDAAQESLATDEFTESVRAELESIDGRLAGSDDESVGNELDDVSHAIEDILDNAEPNDGQVGSGSWSSKEVG